MRIIFILFIAVAITTSCSFSKYAQKAYTKAALEAPYDAIIVPGTPHQDSSQLDLIQKARILWAKHLFEKGIAKNIIFSGGAVYTPFYEGKIMKIYADSLGVPSENLFCEIKAEHSTENVYYSKRLAEKLGFKRIAIATDPFQMLMVRAFVKKHTKGLGQIPIVFKMLDAKTTELPKIVDISAKVEGEWKSIKEREGFFKRLNGTYGKNINFEIDLTTTENLKANGIMENVEKTP